MATDVEGSLSWTAFCGGGDNGIAAIDGDAPAAPPPPPLGGDALLDEAAEVERLLTAMEAVHLASKCEVVGSMYEARATLSAEERTELERDCYGDLPASRRRRRKEEERCWTVQKEDVVQVRASRARARIRLRRFHRSTGVRTPRRRRAQMLPTKSMSDCSKGVMQCCFGRELFLSCLAYSYLLERMHGIIDHTQGHCRDY